MAISPVSVTLLTNHIAHENPARRSVARIVLLRGFGTQL